MKKPITALIFLLVLFLSGCTVYAGDSLSLEQMILSDTIAEYRDIIYTDEYASEIDGYLSLAFDPEASSSEVTAAIDSVTAIKDRILNKPIVFIDSNFEAFVKKNLGITSGGFLTYGEIRTVTELDMTASEDMRLTFLDDLSHFPNLTSLILSDSSLTDFSPIASLTSLERLDISRAAASDTAQPDMSFLSSLPSLRVLKAKGLGITSLSFLENISGIESLDVADNPITDYSGILYCPSLMELDVSGCSFSNMTIFAMLGNLSSFKLENGLLSSLTGIENMSSLISLDLSGTSLSSPDGIGSLLSLRELDLSDTGLKSAAFLTGLPLKNLDISDNELMEASFLSYMPSLISADISGNMLTTLTLSGTSPMEKLDLSGNFLTSLLLTGDFSALSELNVSNNALSVLYLDTATGLTELDASYNSLDSANFITYLTSLKKLTLDGNPIASMPSLAGLPLVSLSLVDMPFESTGFLSGVTSLTELDMWNTDITDLSGLADKSGIKKLRVKLSDVKNLSGFEGIPHVTELSVYGMTDSSWDYLSAFTELESVFINRSKITYLNLHDMPYLRSLRVVTCRTLTDISRVYNNPELEEYYLEYVDVYNPYISGFPKLKSLTVLDGNVERVDGISGLPVCEYINLSENEELEDMTFAAMPSLKTLIIASSELTTDSLKNLSVVMNMGRLDLSDNSIRKLTYFSFEKDELVSLDLSDNMISDFSSLYPLDIPEVIWDGNRGEYSPPEAEQTAAE